jgi:hypothetical protein
MREAIIDNRPADLRGITIDVNLPARERYADYNRQMNGRPNDFICDGILVHETFDPDGPEFADCVIRLFV